MSRKYQQIIPKRKAIKSLLAKIILWFLGRGIKAASNVDPIVKKELEPWKENSIVLLKVNDFGPMLALKKVKGRLIVVNPRKVNPDLAIYFKNIEVALLVLTGRLGIAQGFAEHRYGVKGDIAFSMSFVRILYIVESYLFPAFITKKILKEAPIKGSNSFIVYLRTIIGF